MIELQRVYDSRGMEGGRRFLVDRMWPRGVKKTELPLDGWLKDVAPSAELRQWFGHEPAKWKDFQKRYAKELDAHPEAWEPLAEAARRGRVTLLFSAKDTEHNNAVALKAYLEARTGRPRRAPGVKSGRRTAARRPASES